MVVSTHLILVLATHEPIIVDEILHTELSLIRVMNHNKIIPVLKANKFFGPYHQVTARVGLALAQLSPH